MLEYFPEQPARQGSRRGAAGQGRLDRHDDHRLLDLGDGRAGIRHARSRLCVRQLRAGGKALDGGVGERSPQILLDRTGARSWLGIALRGAQRLFQDPVHQELAEIKGVKLRVLPTTAFIETFKLMGAIPTPIPFNELYTAVQTGVVDGFEHDAATVLATKLNEVLKYCWLTEHLFSPMIVVIGKRGLDKVPADARDRFPARPRRTRRRYQRGQAQRRAQAAIDELKRLGITFAPMAKAERESVRKEMETRLWTALRGAVPGDEAVVRRPYAARRDAAVLAWRTASAASGSAHRAGVS